MASAPSHKRRTRLSPEAREAMILHAAIEFFAERGFAAQTRELAARLGISEPLIYRYFPTKEALIQRVFQEVIESRWDSGWTTLLRDRDIPLSQRLLAFYDRYLDAIDDGVWVRIVMYASLDGLDMTRQYIRDRVDEVLGIIATESAASMGLDREVDPELVWHLHSTLIYFLIRKHIHLTAVAEDRSAVASMAVNAFIETLAAQAPARRATRVRRGTA
ncbi:TetR/AcrR family transcriptional regulator [Amycolatopsis pithecellobii]|uniref:TetR family transcriptional regulator n=1 Tax=Amycolatopsis pithecellobii TaxID=664692 RepID=A0A6N7YXT6_9PSEU|nr:TetR/AcrR family transcriptional regulator [Amycolatopsis pithecellobii]MTD53703.1 TetR family transcriptional regulator [Amycolatopsis pithecellobii]